MMRAFRLFLFLIVALVPALGQGAPKVHVRLIASQLTAAPGQTITVALEQNIAPGWHTYWSNPGDAGLPTTIAWTLPEGWKASAIRWPYPKREPVGPLMDYGYEGKPWLLTDLTVPEGAKPGDMAKISASVQWLVCREVCIPEDATVNLALFVATNTAPPDAIAAEQFADARAKIPAPSPWPVRYARTGDVRLYVQALGLAGAAKPVDVVFFPARSGAIIDTAPQKLSFAGDGLVLTLAPGAKLAKERALEGVLVLTSADASRQALQVKAMPGAVPHGHDTAELGLLIALLFALLGGLILNIMPCVLPVLAMKALALARHGGAKRQAARAEAFAYCFGAVATFVAFGLTIVALRAGGAAIGWGFQLQEPVVVAGLALLLFAVGLNLSGVFEVDAVTAGDGLARKGGLTGAFFTGVLAVAVAAPCTAPFMAAAIGYGLTQSAPIVLALFTALGIGFALPFVLIGLIPTLQRLLPKPGAWMVRFKQFLALPMYGAAAWLFWVLSQQVSRGDFILALIAAAVLGISLGIWGSSRTGKKPIRRLGTFFVLIGIAASIAVVSLEKHAPAPVMQTTEQGFVSEPYTAARLRELRKEKRAVFVDATASWCITCLVNEEAALSRGAVRAAFRDRKIVYLVADWTNRNPEITALLAAHGRSGVPLCLYYAPGADEAVILPQILTEGEVLKALKAPYER